MAENYKYTEKKTMVAKVRNCKCRGRLDISVQSSPLLLFFFNRLCCFLKPYNITIPNQQNVSVCSQQPSAFFRLCGSREFLLAHIAKQPRKMRGNNILQLNGEESCLLPSILSTVNKIEVADVLVCRIDVKWCMMLQVVPITLLCLL